MIKININLLPNTKKGRLKNLVKFIFSKYILEITIITCSIIAMSMIWSWVLLQDSYAELIMSSASVNKEYASYNREIKNINSLVKDINKSNSEYQTTIPKLIEFANNLPSNIKINSFYLDRHDKTLTIEGTALTRQDLLDYQETLKKLEWIGSVDTPVSKLFQKNNISFEFKTQIKNFVAVK